MSSDQLRISIEMGDEYQPTSRLRAALDELGAALAELDDAEVAGFAGGVAMPGFRVLGFTHEHVEHLHGSRRQPTTGDGVGDRLGKNVPIKW
ncbi:MAG TPA: hypothetical protein VK866_07415 [Acidimicrobiales bacterium]|nr:hypothetical protein [Acidimicrobiales bacterium]